jgi:hypothetical protein
MEVHELLVELFARMSGHVHAGQAPYVRGLRHASEGAS